MHVMHVLGLLAERFPSHMVGHDKLLLDVFLRNLHQEVLPGYRWQFIGAPGIVADSNGTPLSISFTIL